MGERGTRQRRAQADGGCEQKKGESRREYSERVGGCCSSDVTDSSERFSPSLSQQEVSADKENYLLDIE